MEKLEILPQIVFKFKCEDSDIISDTISNLVEEKWKQNPLGNYVTNNCRLENDKKYSKLCEWFEQCLSKVKTELSLDCERLKLIQMWANKAEMSNMHGSHFHSNSLVSGIFYLTDSNAKTHFYSKSIWNNYNGENFDNVFNLTGQTNKSYQNISHSHDTSPGELIIFPSNLLHSVDQHKVNECPRYTIAFNSFPCGMIGNFMNLNGMKISIS